MTPIFLPITVCYQVIREECPDVDSDFQYPPWTQEKYAYILLSGLLSSGCNAPYSRHPYLRHKLCCMMMECVTLERMAFHYKDTWNTPHRRHVRPNHGGTCYIGICLHCDGNVVIEFDQTWHTSHYGSEDSKICVAARRACQYHRY